MVRIASYIIKYLARVFLVVDMKTELIDKDIKEEAIRSLEDYEKILFAELDIIVNFEKYFTVPANSTFEEEKAAFLDKTREKIINVNIETIEKDLKEELPYFILIKEINQFKNTLSETNNEDIEAGLKFIFEKIKQLRIRAHGISLNNPKLFYQLLGWRGADSKIQNLYQERLQIFFDLLLEEAKENGKWKNAKQAVESVFPIIVEKFEAHTRLKVHEELNNCVKRIGKLRYVIEEAIEDEEGKVDLSLYGERMHLSKACKLIKEDQLFFLQLQKALMTKIISTELKKKLKIAYEADYSEEVLLRNLRKNKSLLEQIIDKENGRRVERS